MTGNGTITCLYCPSYSMRWLSVDARTDYGTILCFWYRFTCRFHHIRAITPHSHCFHHLPPGTVALYASFMLLTRDLSPSTASPYAGGAGSLFWRGDLLGRWGQSVCSFLSVSRLEMLGLDRAGLHSVCELYLVICVTGHVDEMANSHIMTGDVFRSAIVI
jgi:hypothetical protein